VRSSTATAHLPSIGAMQSAQLGEIFIAVVEGASFLVALGATLRVRRSPDGEGGRSASRAMIAASLLVWTAWVWRDP
jgi:hypothetical protein